MDISVIIACYNAADFIERAIHSALASAGVSLEVIVVDDCSQDDSLKVLRRLSAEDRRVRFISLPQNVGPGGARNAGIEAAQGDWVAILDADDAITPDRLQTLLGMTEVRDLVADNVSNFDLHRGEVRDRLILPQGKSAIDFAEFLRSRHGNEYGLLQPIIRRGFLQSSGVRYPNMRHGEDWEFVARLLEQGAIYHLERGYSGYLYTTRDSGLSQTRIDDAGLIRAAKAWRQRVKGNPALVRLVDDRIKLLRNLQLNRMSGVGGSRIKIMKAAAKSPTGILWAARWLGAKVKRQ